MRSFAHQTFLNRMYWRRRQRKILATISHLSIFDLLFTIFTFCVRARYCASLAPFFFFFCCQLGFLSWLYFVATMCVLCFHFADIFRVFGCCLHCHGSSPYFRFVSLAKRLLVFWMWFSIFLSAGFFSCENRFHSLYEMAFACGASSSA